MPRRNSLRLPIQPPEVPVPPSLVGSPYLRSGRYQGQRGGPVQPHYPSEEDELWLQDTVPIGSPSPNIPQSAPSSWQSSSSMSSSSSSSSSTNRAAARGQRSQHHHSPITSPRAPTTPLPSGPRAGEPDRSGKRSSDSRRGSMQIVEAGLLATATFDFGLPASLSPGSRQAWRRTAAGYTLRTSPTCPGPLPIGTGGGGMLSPPSHYFADMNSVR